MYTQRLTKADGRALRLYRQAGPPDGRCAPAPPGPAVAPNSHLRWHPLRGEWVVYAGHRQHRTFLPPADFNPLIPDCDPARATEVPDGAWDVAVFDNLFPTFTATAHDPPDVGVPTAPGRGVCEVVVFTQDPATSLGRLPLWHLELLIDVWAERYHALGARDDVHYVFPFENRGPDAGVTLHHPHGQIYGYPFIPPIPARELALQAAHLARDGTGLLERMAAQERDRRTRMIYQGEDVVAFLPACARYSFEVWILPYRAAPSLAALTAAERRDFAAALKTTLLQLDGLWESAFPYVLVFHQAPTDGHPHPEAHVHLELYPAWRMPGRLKYLAGSELGAGVFTADTVPEDKASEMRSVAVDIHS
jgi:UDPglucose--hexose-1-phosphate uridylyltransferase